MIRVFFSLLLLHAAVSNACAQGTTSTIGDALSVPLTAEPGDAARGRVVVTSRQIGLCTLCHAGPFPDERQQGTLGPDLRGVGSRLTAAQLRQRLVDARAVNPQSIMPAYFRKDGLAAVGAAWKGKTVLGAQQIEDVVAFLKTLK